MQQAWGPNEIAVMMEQIEGLPKWVLGAAMIGAGAVAGEYVGQAIAPPSATQIFREGVPPFEVRGGVWFTREGQQLEGYLISAENRGGFFPFAIRRPDGVITRWYNEDGEVAGKDEFVANK